MSSKTARNEKRDTIARNTTVVLILLLIGAFAALGMQRVQIREMQSVDCAAYAERVSRIGLYDDLMKVWSRDRTLPANERQAIVDAYGRQRLAVMKAVEVGNKQGCG